MKDENLLSSMKDRNEWWNQVFSRVAGRAEVTFKPIEIPAPVLGRILTDADRAVVLKERLDELRTKVEYDAAAKEANEMFSHRSPPGTGEVSSTSDPSKMVSARAKCPSCKAGICILVEPGVRHFEVRCSECGWKGIICPQCGREVKCLVHPYECGCGGWDTLEGWIRGTSGSQECPECHRTDDHKMGCSKRSGKGMRFTMKSKAEHCVTEASNKVFGRKKLMDQLRDNFTNGGAHLGAVRGWIQHTFQNGSQVTWGSLDELGNTGLSVKCLEQLAEEIKDAVLRSIEPTVERETQDKPAPEHKPSKTLTYVSKLLTDLSQKIRKEYVPSGAEQMSNISGEDMLDIALKIKEAGNALLEDVYPGPVVWVEQDEHNNVVGVYASGYSEFEYPENGTQTPYEVNGAGKMPNQHIGDCECCGDTRRLLRGLCHPCTRSYFEDAEQELKKIREEKKGRIWRVVWLQPGTVTTAYKVFWDREDASKFAKELEDKKITVGVESVEVQG